MGMEEMASPSISVEVAVQSLKPYLEATFNHKGSSGPEINEADVPAYKQAFEQIIKEYEGGNLGVKFEIEEHDGQTFAMVKSLD